VASGDKYERVRRMLDEMSPAAQLKLVAALSRRHAKTPGVSKNLDATLSELLDLAGAKEEELDQTMKVVQSHMQSQVRWTRYLRIAAWRRGESVVVAPPSLLGASLMRKFLRPADYKRIIEPHIADMHEEYFACLAKKDERGARWAVIRGNLYAVPSWLWGLVAQLLARVIGWMRT
jgi:hypothetical protein